MGEIPWKFKSSRPQKIKGGSQCQGSFFIEDGVEKEKPDPKVVLTTLSQQYGLTVENVMEEFGIERSDVHVEGLD